MVNKNSDSQENVAIKGDEQVINFIRRWTYNDGWKLRDFEMFAEKVGLQLPIEVSDGKSNTFKCKTEQGREVEILLRFGNQDFPSEIWITEGNETRTYDTNANYPKDKAKPEVYLVRRIVVENDKELDSFYCDYFCLRTLKIGKKHKLKVEMAEPYYPEEKDVKVLRNKERIEEYLLTLDASLKVEAVYQRIIALLDFSEEDVNKSKNISIKYIEINGKKETIKEEIQICRGVNSFPKIKSY